MRPPRRHGRATIGITLVPAEPQLAALLPVGTETPRPWHPATRLLFRVTFCYTLQYALFCGNATLWRVLPHFGVRLEAFVAQPYLLAAQALSGSLLHLQGPAAHLHGSGYGDRALDWIAAALMLVLALQASALWSAFARRTEYASLFTWLRFALRFTLIVAMFHYGSWKIFPVQMPSPSLAVLNEPLGQGSPMTLLWTLLGLSGGYERLCGLIEFSCGLLLLFRRTALAGALLSAFVLLNVLLFNLFFDVPVKLYAANILLMSLVLLAPDLPALLDLFWHHRPASLTSAWAPCLSSRPARLALTAFQAAIVLSVGVIASRGHYLQHAAEQANARNPSPLTGEWLLDATSAPAAPLTAYGLPMTALYIEPTGRVELRSADGTLWGGSLYRPGSPTLLLAGPGLATTNYALSLPGPGHLRLTPPTRPRARTQPRPPARQLPPAAARLPPHQRVWHRPLEPASLSQPAKDSLAQRQPRHWPSRRHKYNFRSMSLPGKPHPFWETALLRSASGVHPSQPCRVSNASRAPVHSQQTPHSPGASHVPFATRPPAAAHP